MSGSSPNPDRSPPRRRRGLALLALIPLAAIAWRITWPEGPALTSLERRLVGEWGHPQINDESLTDIGLRPMPLTNPWQVVEFAPDRSYRVWYVSADHPVQRKLVIEGRWRIVDGLLRLEDMRPSVRRLLRDVRYRIDQPTILPVDEIRIAHAFDNPFRLDGDELVMLVPIDELPVNRRLPGAFRPTVSEALTTVRRDQAFSGWVKPSPGSPWVRATTATPK